MSRWCQLGVGRAAPPPGRGPAAVLWDMRGTSATDARPGSSGPTQQRGPSAPASPAAAGGAAATPTPATATRPTRRQDSRRVLRASIGAAGTLLAASGVPVQRECPAQSGTVRDSLSVTRVHSEAQVGRCDPRGGIRAFSKSTRLCSQVPAATCARRVFMATLKETGPAGPASVMDTSAPASQEAATAPADNVSSA